MNKQEKVKKAVDSMWNMLKEISDDKLISGYKKALEDYEKTKNEQHNISAMIIKEEIDRRKLKV